MGSMDSWDFRIKFGFQFDSRIMPLVLRLGVKLGLVLASARFDIRNVKSRILDPGL